VRLEGSAERANADDLVSERPSPPYGEPRATPLGDEAPEQSAGRLLEQGLGYDREGNVSLASEHYRAALRTAEANADRRHTAEALRRLGVLLHRSGDLEQAREYCQRSFQVAALAQEATLAAEALNALGGFALESGEIDQAEILYRRALEHGNASDRIRSHIEQNLGVIANIQGNLSGALAHYESALQASRRAGDDRGTAVAYHNLGMVSADLKQWSEADRYFQESHTLAGRVNDTHLRALCLLNRTEVYLATGRFDEARQSADQALTIFEQLHAPLDKADAYKMLGTVFRETGDILLAEEHLQAAIQLAVSTGAVLSEAEATRELAILFQGTGRNQEALAHLNTAYRLFGRLKASVDLVDVASKVEALEGTYLTVVRDWGQSIESADAYTHGHCERVASYAVAVAEQLGVEEAARTTIRLGAYLHDVGKVRVPHEILNKPGALTPEEFGIIKKHPEWGVELITEIDFPWDIKPIIRSHHEKYDGTGYPDGLRGDTIPVAAQIICVVDVYDALTTTRSYRGAMSKEKAMEVMEESRRWWRPDIYEAFRRTVL
jgi:putative nucleotidyltransferase with HDIG domain